ncbi:MAG: type II 3-dehydroquinate dehydratase, partial [Dolichospermum sp.]
MHLLILNGPNLNLIGQRETQIYGNLSFENFFAALELENPEIKLSHYQSNIEGELINAIQLFEGDGIILNAGGYTHTSVA